MYTILIIEDHKDFREAVLNFLRLSNVQANLLEASSWKQGISVAERERPEIILIDFWLKGINGIQTAAQIKTSVPECSIIMLTMFDLKDVRPLVNSEIIEEFISKSDLYEKLLPSIYRVLNANVRV